MRHATGWDSRSPGYRNHYCASEGHHSWGVIQELCGRGWMRVSRKPSELIGGDVVFSVTAAGLAELQLDEDARTNPRAERERLQRAVWLELEKLSDGALHSWIDRGFKTVSGLARALLELRHSEEPTR